jgi:site-specific DNA recombinase
MRAKVQKLKAAIYTRVSSSGQAKDGNGLDIQLEKCSAVLTVKGWELYKVYSNPNGVRGTTKHKDRKELVELFEDAKKGLFSAVIFSALDRIGRTSRIIEDIVIKLQKLNLKIYCCHESIDTTTEIGTLMLQMMSNYAQYDRSMLVKRLKEGLNASAKKRGERGGPIPYGYKRSDDDIEIYEEEAKIVRLIFQEREKGTSYAKIANLLNEMNIRPKKAKTKEWSDSTIKGIVSRKNIYQGCLRNSNISGIYWPKILETKCIPLPYIRPCSIPTPIPIPGLE